MLTDGTKISEGYFYNFWNEKIKEVKGEIWSIKMDSTKKPEKIYFIITDENGQYVKRLICSKVEGTVYNNGVWLSKSNKTKAIELLIKHELMEIYNLYDQINEHKNSINILEKELA